MTELDTIESRIDVIEQGKRLFVFDMDDTLCNSKCSIDEEM